jgi:hypothetical protein
VQSTAPPAEPPADVPADPPKAEARAILDNLRATFGAAPRVMPSAKPSPIDIYADVERDDVDHDRY